MNKALVDRELLGRVLDPETGEEWSKACRELRNVLAQPAEAEGVEVVATVHIGDPCPETGAHDDLELLPEDCEFYDGECLIRQTDHIAALSAVTAERDQHEANAYALSAETVAQGELIDQLRAEVEELRKDKGRLDAIEQECWDVRFLSSPNGDAGDSSISIEVVGHFMAEPCERVVGENYNENLRAALDQAMTAEAYPPARPEYDERGRPVRAMAVKGSKPEHICPGCGGHGWTGNCDQCIPY